MRQEAAQSGVGQPRAGGSLAATHIHVELRLPAPVLPGQRVVDGAGPRGGDGLQGGETDVPTL
jgi:hypothetical protein